jgi:hypothetical protein
MIIQRPFSKFFSPECDWQLDLDEDFKKGDLVYWQQFQETEVWPGRLTKDSTLGDYCGVVRIGPIQSKTTTIVRFVNEYE